MKRDDESNAKVERDEFHDFLSTAEPRPVPGRGRKEEIYAELRDEWLAGRAESRRRRQYIVSGIAASFVAAILLALVQNTDPGTEIPPPHAAMARITGNGTLVNGRAIEALWDADETLRFAQGDSILTGENAALAIAWNDGGSLRVRSATALKVVSHDRIELAEGEIYYDSRSHDTAGTAELAVDTPHGTIRHIGTQFLARVDSDGIRIGVREGQVEFRNQNNASIYLNSGESVHIDRSLTSTYSSLEPTDSTWNWATAVAPHVDVDGRSTHQIINWLSKETGLTVEYENEAAESFAMNDQIRGLGGLDPLRALSVIPVVTDLTIDIDDRRIHISLTK